MKFDPEKKTKFSTHLANETKWKCLNMINKIKRKKENGPPSETKGEARVDNLLDNIQRTEAWDAFKSALDEEKDPRVKKIIDIRYNTDNNKLTPWRLVAEELQMSIQGCINLHVKFINKVKTKLDYV